MVLVTHKIVPATPNMGQPGRLKKFTASGLISELELI